MKHSQTISNLLTNKNDFFNESLSGRPSRQGIWQLLSISAGCFFIYGAIIGAFHSPLQAFSSALKLPVLFLLTALVCFPTLYFFLVILGVKKTPKQLISFGLANISFIGLTQMAFAPIALFFLMTENNYFVIKLVNVGIFTLSGLVGLYGFYTNLKRTIEATDKPEHRKRALAFLHLWLILFAFIGTQLSFNLSPFFGHPDEAFIWFTPETDSFFMNIIRNFNGLY